VHLKKLKYASTHVSMSDTSTLVYYLQARLEPTQEGPLIVFQS